MFNFIMALICLIMFFICWYLADTEGRVCYWLCTIACGVMALLHILVFGGIL